eukprot:COSAG03_NODE_2921_length_2352_cov_938.717960_2_plen_112_part_00
MTSASCSEWRAQLEVRKTIVYRPDVGIEWAPDHGLLGAVCATDDVEGPRASAIRDNKHYYVVSSSRCLFSLALYARPASRIYRDARIEIWTTAWPAFARESAVQLERHVSM